MLFSINFQSIKNSVTEFEKKKGVSFEKVRTVNSNIVQEKVLIRDKKSGGAFQRQMPLAR